MRYEDASQAGSMNVQAHDDTEHLAGNDFGPATGNLITGSGTVSGAAGVDTASGAHITSIAGAGGSDDSFDASGNLEIAGQYGTLSIDAQGNYTYVRAPGSPEGVSDEFTYTLADSAGATDMAKLTVAIGNPPILQAEGTQTTLPNGAVVVLPPGVELSDVRVVGRDLVVTLPDGSTMVIPDGAVFVPQLVVNGVEVPASNLAALLIDSEPKPAAGDQAPSQLSSGGNFEVPVQPLDPGVPLGDLIPPTELHYTPPEVKEVFDRVDTDPEAGIVGIQLDDDVIPGKGGNPGGTGDNAPDTVGQNVVAGNLPGSGGESPLSWAFLDTGEPAVGSFTYTLQPDGDLWVYQTQDGNPVLVLTIDLNADTGAFTATQVNAIRHEGGGNENNVVLPISYTVTDDDGDVATGQLNIDVDDDTPTASVTAGDDSEVLLITDDADTEGDNSDTDSTSADFSGVFTGTTSSPGADGAGEGTTGGYTLNVTSQTSGLSSHGAAINLYMVGDVVVGATGTQPADLNDADIVFTVEVDANGVVTLTQLQQIDHAAENPSDAPFNDQFASLTDGLVTLTRSITIVDNDNDPVTASETVNIGANLHFTDDGPTVEGARGASSVTLDETDGAEPVSAGDPIIVTSDDPMIVGLGVDYGADGQGGDPVYGLSLLGGVESIDSGLATADGDHAITLELTSSTLITGTYNGGADTAFTIKMNADGTVTVTQYTALEHLIDGSTPADYDDSLSLVTSINEQTVSLINATITYEDFDHDTATAEAPIGDAITFKDDGPSVEINVGTESDVELITDDADTEGTDSDSDSTTANFAGVFSLGGSNGGGDGTASTSSINYALATAGGASGLTSHGEGINLYMVGDVVVGATGSQPADLNDADIVFTVEVDGDGVVTLTQLQQIDHPAVDDPDGTDAPFNDHTISMLDDGLITLTAEVTIEDNDGDTATDSETIDIAANLVFTDDGPTVTGVHATSSVLLDETDGDEPVSSGSPIIVTSDDPIIGGGTVDYGADGQGPDPLFGLKLLGGVDSIASGLATADGDHAITLELTSSTLITGTYNGGADTAFTIEMNADGSITVTQYTALEHGVDGSSAAAYDDAVDLINGASNLVIATVTYEDFDGDTASAEVPIGGAIVFEDDGPSIDVTAGSDAEIELITDDEGTEGSGSTDDSTTADFAGAFAIGSSSGGGDGTASVTSLQYSLTTAGGPSGLSSHGVAINLYMVGDVVVGATGTQPADLNDADIVFTVEVDSDGVVTLTQLKQIDHPAVDDPDGTDAPFNDHHISMLDDSLISLTAEATITDNDGDTATDSETIDIAANLTFRDDGPTADNDGNINTVDDSATALNIGNVSTLLNGDDYGADGPAAVGAITIGVGDQGGTITIDGSGNLLYTAAADASGGNVVETFTYTIKDYDGDTASATFTVTLTDSAAVIGTTAFAVDEEGLDNGLAGTVYGDGSDLAGESVTASGNLTGLNFGGDGAGNIVLAASADTGLRTLSNQVVKSSWDGTTHTLTGFVDLDANGLDAGDITVFTLQIDDVATGHYEFELFQPVKHSEADTEDNVLLSVTVTATDSEGDGSNGTINITIDDDSPNVEAVVNNDGAVELDETLPSSASTITLVGIDKGNDPDLSDATGIAIGRAVSAESVLTLTTAAYGADGPAANPDDAAYTLSVDNASSGLTTTEGDAITLVLQQNGTVIVGVVGGVGPNAGDAAFAIAINPETGIITVEQYLSLDHPVEGSSAAAHNDPLSMTAGHISANVTIEDADGDTDSDTGIDISGLITFRDDGPDVAATLNTDAAVELDETLPSSASTITLVGIDKGNDPDLSDATGIAIGRAVSAESVLTLTTENYGADGPAANPDDAVYTLAINNATSGLTTTEGDPITLQLQQNGTVIVGVVGGVGPNAGDAAFAIAINPETGFITVEQYLSLDHPVEGSTAAAHNDPLSMTAGHISAVVTIEDGDGDTDTSTPVDISGLITFRDDGPSVTTTAETEPTLTVDETDLTTDVGPISFAGLFDVDFGADGPASSGSLDYELNINPGSTGLVDTATGEAIELVKVGETVVGRTETSHLTSFIISVNADGEVSLDQQRAIVHPDDADPNDVTLMDDDGLITLSLTAKDGDGDTHTVATPIEIARNFEFYDDGPAITTPATDPLNIVNDDTPSGKGDFVYDVGADTNSDFDDISVANFTVSINGVPVPLADIDLIEGVEDANAANYTFNFDYDTGSGGIQSASGTLTFYKTGPDAGKYEVTLDGPIEGKTILDLNGISADDFVEHQAPSQPTGSPEIVVAPFGDNLFVQFTGYARATNGSNLLQTADWGPINPDPAPEAPADPNTAFVSGDLFTDIQAGLPSVTVSENDAGVDGNTIQTGEVIDFNLYSSDPGGDTGLTPSASAEDMFILFDNFAADDDLIVVLKLMDPDDGSFTTKAVVVNQGDYYMEGDEALLAGTSYESIVNASTFQSNDALLIIESNDYNQAPGENWVIVGAQVTNNADGVTGSGINLNRALHDPDVAGSGASIGSESFATDTDVSNLKISNIGFVIPNTTAQSATIEFDVTVTDGDGDTVTQENVTVNIGTPPPPVVLDLNGDGVHFLGQDAGVHFDYGAGLVSTAWAAADDGILVRDANHNGVVDNASEFVFGGNGVTDMEALHAQYGDQLDASDADFTMFAVWNDANSNGAVDANELHSLADAGITGIGLVSDGISYTSANGDVSVAGTSTFTRADGSTGDAADAAFWTSGIRSSTQEVERVAANSNSVALAAAVAAAGVAASAPAAAESFGDDHISAISAVTAQQGLGDTGFQAAYNSPAFEIGNAWDSGFAASIQALSGTSHTAMAAASIGELTANLALGGGGPNALLEGTDFGAMMHMPAPAMGMDVIMPSAAALAAAAAGNAIESQVTALNAQHTGQVEQILADALHGGGAGMDINALLNALPGQGGAGIAENAGLQGLATQGGEHVPLWDMGHASVFTMDIATIMTGPAMVLHHDAVQPVANG